MGLKQEIDFSELAKITERMNGIKLRVEDLRNAAPGIRLILQEDVDTRFQNAPATETGGMVYGGVRWAELSDSYLAQNPRRFGGQILRDSGELQQSLTTEGHPYNVFDVGDSDLVFGTALAKARTLQRKRPFLFWHTMLIEKIAGFLADYYDG